MIYTTIIDFQTGNTCLICENRNRGAVDCKNIRKTFCFPCYTGKARDVEIVTGNENQIQKGHILQYFLLRAHFLKNTKADKWANLVPFKA